MDNKIEQFKNIKGFLDHAEGEFLYELARTYCKKSFAVEIGSYCGKSACYIAAGCKQNNRVLISIDHHKGSEEQQFGQEYFDPKLYDKESKSINTFPHFQATVKKFQFTETIIPLVMTSQSASKILSNNIDLIFIDGSHTFESARNDYQLWSQKLNNTGILAIHDIYDTEAQGGQAPKEIYEKALSEGFILIDRVKSLVALQRST